MDANTIIFIILAAITGGFCSWFFLKKKQNADGKDEVFHRIELLENTFKNVNDMTLKQLGEIKSDVSENLRANRESVDSSSRTMHQQVGNFTESITRMQGDLRNVFDSIKVSNEKMSSFQDIFKTPKLRGQWGEYNLEYLLEQTYSRERVLKQHYFKNGKSVDFAIKLPNDLLLPIDSKFPLEIFVSYAEETSIAEKTRKKQTFISEVKKQIDSISSKYINPDESTTDFALLYIPAEAVYYEIMFSMKEDDIVEYAQKRKIQLVSPNTLKLNLSVIEHWVKDITVNKETRQIIKRLSGILQDGKKLSESFVKLGKHISNVKGAYDDSEKRLELLSGKVEKVITIGKGNKIEEEDYLLDQPISQEIAVDK
ncbi:MAG: DNA recombination protein RmuC [Patescibacteria group bacterium]